MNLLKSPSAKSPIPRALVIAGVCFILGQHCVGEDSSGNEFDYLIEIESKPIKGFLKYQDSKFGNFYKLIVHSSDAKTKDKIKYQEMYTCSKLGDKPALVGLRRFAPLQKEMKKKTVVTQVKFSDKSPSEEEVIAASYGVAPIMVDLLLRENFAGNIVVPVDNFFAFKQALNTIGFQPAAQVAGASTNLIPLSLSSEPKGRYEAMFYSPALKKK